MEEIKIWNRDHEIIYVYHGDDNCTFKDAVQEAIKNKVDLSNAFFHGAELSYVNFEGYNLSYADFSNADLYKVRFDNTNLTGANFFEAHLIHASFRGSILNNSFFDFAVLYDVSFVGSNMEGVFIGYMQCIETYGSMTPNSPKIPMMCPSDGSFVGWCLREDCHDNLYVIKIEIPEDAIRCTNYLSVCICNKAKVLSITNPKTGESINEFKDEKANRLYRIGEMVYDEHFDSAINWPPHDDIITFYLDKQFIINMFSPWFKVLF